MVILNKWYHAVECVTKRLMENVGKGASRSQSVLQEIKADRA